MMSLATIHANTAIKAAEAADQNKEPLEILRQDEAEMMLPRIPFLGDYLPPKWRRVNIEF